MTVMTVEQALTPVRWPTGWVVLTTPGRGWAIRWAGRAHGGWVFYRALRWPGGITWETWEPTLPHGVEAITDRTQAVQVLTRLVDTHGDGPLLVGAP